MTLGELVREYGFDDIPEVEKLGDTKKRTLYNWKDNYPERLRVYLIGCWIKKSGILSRVGET